MLCVTVVNVDRIVQVIRVFRGKLSEGAQADGNVIFQDVAESFVSVRST